MLIKSTVFNGGSLHYCPPGKSVSMGKIFHLADKTAWQKAQRTGKYFGSANDAADGFMHFSTREQVRESAAKHRRGVRDLLLLEVDAVALGDALRWEAARGGQLFPHLYAPLSVADVIAVHELPLGDDGLHVFPALDA